MNDIKKTISLSVASAALLLSAAQPAVSGTTIDSRLGKIVSQHKLNGDPSIGRNLPSITSPKAQLGKHLFFTKILSGDQSTACVSCHHPMLGGGDNLSLPIGVGALVPDLLGPGRVHSPTGLDYDAGPTVPRNAPSTFNVGMWDEVLFHDGRLESLGKTPLANGADGAGIRTPVLPFGVADPRAFNLVQAQAMFPVSSQEEMRSEFLKGENLDTLHSALSDRIKNYDGWNQAFSAVYAPDANGDVINRTNIFDAIAQYERSQVFVENRWKRYIEGDTNALSSSEKYGALLFFTPVNSGGAGCASCHSGDFFTDEQFHVVGFPQIGRGKGDDKYKNGDLGRFRETKKPRDKYAFRTPTLLNIEYTAPYGHAGSFDSLEKAIAYHADPEDKMYEYRYGPNSYFANIQSGMQRYKARYNTRKAVKKLGRLIEKGRSKLVPQSLTTAEVTHLAGFLRSLSDTRTQDRQFMSQWIPSDLEPDIDGTRLRAFDKNGNAL